MTLDVVAHSGLAASLARRYAGRGETLNDLKQVAMLALVKAAQRFDPDRGTAFSTYATATVDGELKRHSTFVAATRSGTFWCAKPMSP